MVTSDWMNGLVAGVEDVDPAVKRRAQFFTRLLTDAFSPSNFLASNPVALKALADEGGVPASKVAEAIKKYGINADKINPLYA